MEGKAKTRPEILRVVLGPYMQYCPCEASEQKLGQKPESELKVIELSYCHHSIRLKKKAFRKKECRNWTKNDQVVPNLMFLCQSGIWPILCQLMAILAKFVFLSIYIHFDIQTKFFWRPKSKISHDSERFRKIH